MPGVLVERIAPEAVGEIDLVSVAFADAALDFVEGAGVGVGCGVGLPSKRQGGGGGRQIDGFGLIKQPEPKQGQRAGGPDGEGGIEGGCGFVRDPAGGVEAAVVDGALDFAQAGQDVLDAGGGDRRDWVLEPEPAAGSLVAEDDEILGRECGGGRHGGIKREAAAGFNPESRRAENT